MPSGGMSGVADIVGNAGLYVVPRRPLSEPAELTGLCDVVPSSPAFWLMGSLLVFPGPFFSSLTAFLSSSVIVEKMKITTFACWVIFHAFVNVVCRLFSKLTFSKNAFRNTIRVSNGLDPD